MRKDIEMARPGQNVTAECKAEAFERIKPKRGTMYAKILDVLDGHPMTASEVAQALYDKGLISDSERQKVAPRLSEMTNDIDKQWTRVIGKKKSPDIRVSIYERCI